MPSRRNTSRLLDSPFNTSNRIFVHHFIPAQKAFFPAPVTMPTQRSRSSRKSFSAPSNSLKSCTLCALNTSGRFRVNIACLPWHIQYTFTFASLQIKLVVLVFSDDLPKGNAAKKSRLRFLKKHFRQSQKVLTRHKGPGFQDMNKSRPISP